MIRVLAKADCLELLKELPDNSVDSLVTDPPAGISFMGKAWDDDKGGRDEWIKWLASVLAECHRVMKPGAHGLVWALPRTSHWTGMACEQAGFEVRDRIAHLFGSGFPKSLDISKALDKAAGIIPEDTGKGFNAAGIGESNGGSKLRSDHPDYKKPERVTDAAKEWQGWGTALKPACEDWWLIRKPLSEKTVAKNVLKHGTGGINIDASRIGSETISQHGRNESTNLSMSGKNYAEESGRSWQGRFPANLVFTEGEATEMLGEPSRFFYCAKISSSERNAGLDEMPDRVVRSVLNTKNGDGERLDGAPSPIGKNHHPTVKPKKLMGYLIKLITPPGGVVLDPFMGSGSTGVACRENGFDFIGIEKEKEYFEIAGARLA